MDYDDAIRWLLTLPDFERTGDFADRPDLAPMVALLRELGDPHLGAAAADDTLDSEQSVVGGDGAELKLRRYCPQTIHIAGSKGKGSTGAMIEAMLRAAGMRTGHYVSPHLHRYNERIRIDGEPIAPEGFAEAMTAVRAEMASVEREFPGRLLAFDALTAAAFCAFREANVDVQIIEVGLGGTLDSTNVFHPSPNHNRPTTTSHVVVLTPISLEHTAILGDTIQAIARQKAGIITDGCTVVVAPQRESAIDVFTEVARERGATLIEVAKACQMQRTSANAEGQEFRLKTARAKYDGLKIPLAGRHQLENAVTAVVAAEELVARLPDAGSQITESAASDIRTPTSDLAPATVKAGLASVKWPARLEVLTRKPMLIVDGAHNGDSVKRMVAALREDFGLKSAVLLFGTLAGKDVAAMAEQAAPFATSVFVCGWPSARAADPRELAAAFRPYEAPVTTFGTLPDACEAAVAEAGERGAVVAFGALAFVAAVREWLLGIESDSVRLSSR